jgi:acetyl esterase/lipase
MLRPLTLVAALGAALAAAEPVTILPLWNGTPPNHHDSGLVEQTAEDGFIRISKVQTPTIEIRLPSKASATGAAVVICPGGGYGILAYDWEGTDIAGWLNGNGIAAIIVKYRLPEDASNEKPWLSPLLDVKRAMRLTRQHAEKWNIKTDRVGVMGFSAGGHLASTLGTHFDAGNPTDPDPIEGLSSRPDFMILMYPVITMEEATTHAGSRKNLLGENPLPEMIRQYSNELQVSPETPPTFIVHSSDDAAVPVQNSLRFYEALLANGVESEMHLFPYGGHGYSLAVGRGRLQGWSDLCLAWINDFAK